MHHSFGTNWGQCQEILQGVRNLTALVENPLTLIGNISALVANPSTMAGNPFTQVGNQSIKPEQKYID